MRNRILAAQQEDAACRLVQTALGREGFSPITEEEAARLEESGEAALVLRFQLTMTTSGSTAPARTYILSTKPEELLAHTGSLSFDRLEFGRLVIDYRGRSVTVSGRELSLTLKEFEVLSYLAFYKNIPLTRSQLLSAVWEVDYQGDVRTVDSHIKCLRQKLGEYGRCLVTLRGVGYVFRWEDELIG